MRVVGTIFGIVCRIASLEGGNPGSYGHRGMDAADVGECDGHCRFGIDLYVVMAAFGEHWQINFRRNNFAFSLTFRIF